MDTKVDPMGHNSLLGTEAAPVRPDGSSEDLLGPGDSTDSGSDTVGADQRPPADPSEPVDQILERDVAYAPIESTDPDADDDDAGADISADRSFDPDSDSAADDDGSGPIDGAMAPDPLDEEDEASIKDAGMTPP